MPLGGPDPIVGAYQGVWPGIQVLDNGAAKAAPSGSPWIDTNTGFIRSVRAWGPASVWLGYLPPVHSVITGERYQAAIADAEMAGARWIVALDDDFSARLERGDAAATKNWRGMAQVLQFFESHPEWRALRSYGKLAVVQDHDDALLSGGILDMIAAKHTPMRAIPGQRLTPEALQGASMAVDVDAASLTPEQREMLKNFARAGGTVLTAPPGWKGQSALQPGQITLDTAELDRLNDIWHDVQTMTGRKNLGARSHARSRGAANGNKLPSRFLRDGARRRRTAARRRRVLRASLPPSACGPAPCGSRRGNWAWRTLSPSRPAARQPSCCGPCWGWPGRSQPASMHPLREWFSCELPCCFSFLAIGSFPLYIGSVNCSKLFRDKMFQRE